MSQRSFSQSKHSIHFVGNLSGVVMDFKLVIKINIKVSVHCSDVNKYSNKRVRTIVMHCAKVKVLAYMKTLFFNCHCCDHL